MTLQADIPSSHPIEIRVQIDASACYQTIENFGASDAWSMDPIGREWDQANREKIADLLFDRNKGIGLSLWRFNVGAGSAETDTERIRDSWRRAECFKEREDAPYDWSRQAGQQWFLQAARARGVGEFLAFAVSPPVWLTINGHGQCDAQTTSTNLRQGKERAFARFLVDVTEHFRQQGIPFGYISPVNEPEWSWHDSNQEGCRYNTQEIRRLIAALEAQTSKTESPCRIVAPDAGSYRSLMSDEAYRSFTGSDEVYDGGNNRLNTGMYRCYIRELLGKRDGRSSPHIMSVHSYWCDRATPEIDLLAGIRREVRSELDQVSGFTPLWMTEYCVMEHGRDLGMEKALQVAKVLHADLVDAQVSAWHWWLAVSPYNYKDGLIYTDYRRTGEQNVLPSKSLWVLGQYSRFVRPGAHRIRAIPLSDGGRLLVSAYAHQQDGAIAIVLTNPGNDQIQVRLVWDSAAIPVPRNLTPYRTTARDDLSPGSPQAPDSVFALQPRSVTTLTGSWK